MIGLLSCCLFGCLTKPPFKASQKYHCQYRLPPFQGLLTWTDIRFHKIFTEAGCDPDMRSMAEVSVKQRKSLVRLVASLRSLEPLGRKAQSCRTVCVSALKGDCCDSSAIMWDPCCLLPGHKHVNDPGGKRHATPSEG